MGENFYMNVKQWSKNTNQINLQLWFVVPGIIYCSPNINPLVHLITSLPASSNSEVFLKSLMKGEKNFSAYPNLQSLLYEIIILKYQK